MNTDNDSEISWPRKVLNPLTGEEIVFAPHRLQRPRGKKTKCPFCEETYSSYPLIIENKYPSLMPDVPENVVDGAKGFCGVIIYDKAHDTQLEDLGLEKIVKVNELLFQTSNEFFSKYPFIIAFENRGDYFGASLSHPHGQFWAFSWLPENQETYWRMFTRERKEQFLEELSPLTVKEYAFFTIYVHPYPKLPLELLVLPKKHGSFELAALKELSEILIYLRTLVTNYYGFIPQNSLMAWHFPPRKNYDKYLFHLSLHIPHETKDKTKVFGGIEYLAKTFINAFPPQPVAEKLRKVA